MYRILIKYRDNGMDSLYKYQTASSVDEETDEETESYVEYEDIDSLREGVIDMLNNGYALSDFVISGVVECTVDTLLLSGVGIEDTTISDNSDSVDGTDDTDSSDDDMDDDNSDNSDSDSETTDDDTGDTDEESEETDSSEDSESSESDVG